MGLIVMVIHESVLLNFVIRYHKKLKYPIILITNSSEISRNCRHQQPSNVPLLSSPTPLFHLPVLPSSLCLSFPLPCACLGLFRTQHVDGIMGMSAAEDTIPHQLVTQGVTGETQLGIALGLI